MTDFSYTSTDQNDLLGKETEGQNGGEVNGHPVEAMDTDEPEKQEKPAGTKPAIRMSFAEYKRVSNLLVLHMQKMEQCKSIISQTVCVSFVCFYFILFYSSLKLLLFIFPLRFYVQQSVIIKLFFFDVITFLICYYTFNRLAVSFFVM